MVGPNQLGVENVTVEMEEDDECIFKYIQSIVNHLGWSQVCISIYFSRSVTHLKVIQ